MKAGRRVYYPPAGMEHSARGQLKRYAPYALLFAFGSLVIWWVLEWKLDFPG